jgi:polyferredoxin
MSRPFEDTLLRPQERVLSTMDGDGSRRWMWPKLAKGKLWQLRRAFAYLLIALFTITPYLTLNGKPVVLLDVVNRKFHILGQTFLPTDTMLMALLMLSIFLTIFTFTAIFGRVFCGWACPQTVWLEFVYRPIERLFLGTTGRGGKPTRPVASWRYVAMYGVFLLISLHLAHTALAYFVGAAQLHQWILTFNPLAHPGAFLMVAIVTAWMMWDFAYWREQMCIIGCPYGRFQSALLDKHSIIVSFDKLRGEPRGKSKKNQPVSLRVAETHACGSTVEHACGSGRCSDHGSSSCSGLCDHSSPTTRSALHSPLSTKQGDCIDCKMCTQVCPTGIDIRDGLQSECINCTQCVDACNSVMTKLGKPTGLIGYSSQAVREGQTKRFLRPRVVIYPTLLAIVFSLFLILLFTRSGVDMVVLRPPGTPFESVDGITVVNRLKIDVTNRTDIPQTYRLKSLTPGVTLTADDGDFTLNPVESRMVMARVTAPSSIFQRGRSQLTIRVIDAAGNSRDKTIDIRGPYGL